MSESLQVDNRTTAGSCRGSQGSDETLYLSELTRVFRRRLPDGTGIVCKELLGQNAMQRLHHEKRIMERLAVVEGVPRLAEAPHPPGTIAMIDNGAVPLNTLLRGRGLEIPALVQLGAKLAQVLAAVHQLGVAHKNLNPGNLLLSADLRPTLIDFSLATTFAEQRPGFVHHREIAGSLPHLAPEQTGRTGRMVDQRADLYGLGATLYELATGRPPFEAKDPLQLIHDILALLPVPAGQLNRALPQNLSEIIMRLLEKEPDRRYQSAQGVAYDLSQLSEALSLGASTSFPLGQRDFALRLSPPSRLIGRCAEIAALRDSFQQALSGKGCCVVVAGSAGVGKSALLNELRPMVTERRGFFAAGKFDQYRHDLESDAVYQAMRALGRLLLAEPDTELAQLKEKVLQALGPNAGVITALLPEFALLMGKVPEVAPQDPLNSQERLIQAALDLLRAVASPQRPLVMVLDDLQWGAPAPLGFFDALATHQAIPGLLLVGSYREKEVEPDHPLAAILQRWSGMTGESPVALHLGNLPKEELGQFLKEMLRLEPEQSVQLAEAVARRSGGNPYDTVELINALRRDGVLVAGETCWSWNESDIRRYVGHGDVVELLEGRMKRLPDQAQLLLEIMACLGGEVEPELIALAGGLSAQALDEGLSPCLEDGVLVPGERGGAVRFRHDRVQQAAYRLYPGKRRLLHLALARRLSSQPGFETLAAEQYLPALEELQDAAERRLALGLFQSAAARGRTVNFAEAERFLEAALRLLQTVQSASDVPLRIALETERHAALYSLGRLDEADLVYRSIEGLARDPLSRADAACIQVCSLTNRTRPNDAVALGLGMLRELGVAVPEPRELDAKTARSLEQFEGWLAATVRLEDRIRPEPKDLAAMAAARLMNRIIPPAFFCDQSMMAWWLVLESRRLWAEHGPCAALVGPLSHLGFVTITLKRDYLSGHRAVKHVLAVSEARGYQAELFQARFLYSLSLGPWFQPLQDNVLQAQRAHQGLLQGGDLQNACFTYYTSIQQLLDCAPTLESYAADLESGAAFSVNTGNTQVAAFLSPYRELVGLLRGETGCAEVSHFQEQGTESLLAERGNPVALITFHTLRALCGALADNAADLAQHAAAAKPLLPYVQATHAHAQALLLHALALAQQARLAPPAERTLLLAQLREVQSFLAERAADAPGNFLHLVKWLDAERAWAEGDFQAGALAFDAALREVKPLQRPWHRALITEHAALFHLECGLSYLAESLMAEARRLYEAWGALGKVRQLDRNHPFLRAPLPGGERVLPAGQVSADAVDMLAILRASQALSSETSLERLRTQVVQLLGTMTGATAVLLVVREEQSKKWYLLPSSSADGGCLQIPLDEAGGLGLVPVSVFNYAERTGEPLLVEDAIRDDRFNHDRYLADYPCCSLLALPILNHGTPRAVLLLENRLCRGAFTTDLLDAVTLIAGQLAVSLENALLYQSLEERVQKRTRQLQEAQSELMAAARHAGMAEIANNILHNVGNVLNSVNIAAGQVMNRLRSSRVSGLSHAVQLMQQHACELADYLSHDEKGKLLPDYLDKLARVLTVEQQEMVEELSQLRKSVDHIKDIVSTQQSYSGSASLIEPVQIWDLVEDALRMNLDSFVRHKVSVVKEFSEIPVLPLDKARVLQILVNLMNNARQAMDGVIEGARLMTLRVDLAAQGRLRIRVSDQGEGIMPENLSRIFSHGFTTRKDGHGFGLHSCALAATEMGGTLTSESGGAGSGASFTLEIPVQTAGGRP